MELVPGRFEPLLNLFFVFEEDGEAAPTICPANLWRRSAWSS